MNKSNNVLNREYFYKKSNLFSYIFIFIYIAMFFFILYGIHYFNSVILNVILIIILGFFQAGFNQGKHEFLHNTVISNKYLNFFFWYFFSLPILVNPHLNKEFHFGHHKFLGTDKDPELSFKVRQGFSFLEIMIDKLKKPFIFELIAINLKIIFKNKYPNYVNQKNYKIIKIDSIILIYVHIFFIITFIYYKKYDIIFIWYATLEFLGFNILCVYDISEHRGCNISDFYNDSRTVKSNLFITLINWFNNYHSVHHNDTLEKSVVFYKRKKYFEIINSKETKEVEKSYLNLLYKMAKNRDFYK